MDKQNKREDTRYFARLAWSLPWLLRYPAGRAARLLRRERPDASRHLIIMIANHYEPGWTSTGDVLDVATQLGLVDAWADKAQSLCESVKGSDGVPLRHTYFYPGEQYEYRLLARLAQMQAKGLGEVEVHYHHGVEKPDTPERLRAALEEFRDLLAEEHQCLSRMEGSTQPKYGFVHGNWALANSAGGRFCGVDSEMQILSDTGCYADFTLPSIYSRAQVPRINAIYECGGDLSGPSPHRRGPNLRIGRPPVWPVIVTGPTVLDWRAAKRWPPVPRIDDGVMDSKYGLNMARLERWVRAGISVTGRPEWLFIKLYGHAFFAGDQSVLVGDDARRFFSGLCEFAEETGQFKIHFATARETFNIAMAAVGGRQGDPHDYRDFLLHSIMESSNRRPLLRSEAEAATVEVAAAGHIFQTDAGVRASFAPPLNLAGSAGNAPEAGPKNGISRWDNDEPQNRSRIRRSSQLIRAMCEVLLSHPDGLADSAMFSLVERAIDLTDEELEASPSRPLLRRFELAAMRAAIAPLKAGWLQEEGDKWWLTPQGRAALERYPDAEAFLLQAAGRSRKGWLSVFVPRLYWLACSIKFRLTIETQLVRRVGLIQLFGKGLRIGTHWQKVLPIQEPRRFSTESLGFHTHGGMMEFLDANNIRFHEGGHTIYLPPGSARQVFGELMENYPEHAGLKIVKNPGTARESYVFSGHTKISWIHRSLTYSHRHLVLVAGLLSSRGVGPRLFDLLELKIGGEIVTAYVVAHIDGRQPTIAECDEGIGRLRTLEKQKVLKVIAPDGFDDSDFTCPSCNGNALVDASGGFRYVDFQNFHFVDYGSYLKKVARLAQQASHFGDQSLLRGGRYLYQTVPGVRLHGKRNTERRELEFRGLLEDAGLSVNDKVVLDFGCNIGMMIGLYLKLGAAWCHGWDLPNVIEHTETVLLALGCTRFSTTGVKMEPGRDVEADLAPFLKDRLEGCVISYLAVRENLGWLDSLSKIPWGLLLYESHEHETRSEFESDLAQLAQSVSFETRATRVYQDGDCDPRFLALLVREEHLSSAASGKRAPFGIYPKQAP
jgi:hypothetical protein